MFSGLESKECEASRVPQAVCSAHGEPLVMLVAWLY